ncbi:MAG: nucleotide exchange factor GrpE [Patescibacteria group bacterium]
MNENNTKNNDDVILEPENNGSSDDVEFADDNLADTVKKLKEKIKTLEAEKLEYLTGWQRTKADYVNAKKEDEKNRGELMKYANSSFVEELLPALDAFDMAMANKEAWEKVDKNWRAGIEYIYGQIIGTLGKFGVTQENPIGLKVDPLKHNPMGTVATEDKSKEGIVAEVIQKGYMMNGKEIRPARVKVFE